MSSSRRTFLQQVSTAAALGLLGQLPARRMWALAPAEFIPEVDEALLRELALRAIDAARAAGATFADVRVAAGQRLEISSNFERGRTPAPAMVAPSLSLMVGFGIRTLIDGAWGFAAGDELTPDAITRTAATAAARARANRPRRPRTLALAPTPRVAAGRWAAPIAEDPFAVAAGAQADRQLAALSVLAGLPEVRFANAQFTWQRALRVFASTEGSLIVQRTALALPGASVQARVDDQHPLELVSADGFEKGPYGYEVISRVDLPAAMRHAAERAVERSREGRTPAAAVEVGRYDLVLGADAMASLLTGTLARALDAERVLGYRANREGTSFAAPPAEVLGKLRIASPLVTVQADRTRPHGAATVGWDDEGTPAQAFTLVNEGVVVDYLTDRQCAAELAAASQRRGAPGRSNGCASGAGSQRPSVRLPNLALVPAKSNTSVEDLIAATKRGFYVAGIGGGSDQQVLNGQFGASGVRAIRNGKLAEPIKDMAVQFLTAELWKSLDGLGGPATSVTALRSTGLSPVDPLQLPIASVSAVPARVRQVNVLNTGRTA